MPPKRDTPTANNNEESTLKSESEDEEDEVVISASLNLSNNITMKQSVLKLPSTVTKLELDTATVYLVGTAHFSKNSQQDVRDTISLTKPDLILLELCHSRRNILAFDEEMLLREAGDVSWGKILETLKSSPNSRVQSLLHLLLLSMSANLTKKLGMAPGGEFRAAVQEARKLTKEYKVVLADRPFHVTLARAIYSLTLMQKLKLAWQFLSSPDDITKEEIEKCKESDLLEKMLSEMTGEFPSITQVFVNERDIYLAHRIYAAATFPEDNPTKRVVVGVVGMGHVPGIVSNFGTTTDEMVDAVSRMPPEKSSVGVWLLKSSVKLGIYGLVGYGAYKLFCKFDFVKKDFRFVRV